MPGPELQVGPVGGLEVGPLGGPVDGPLGWPVGGPVGGLEVGPVGGPVVEFQVGFQVGLRLVVVEKFGKKR